MRCYKLTLKLNVVLGFSGEYSNIRSNKKPKNFLWKFIKTLSEGFLWNFPFLPLVMYLSPKREFSSGTIRVCPIIIQHSFSLHYKSENFKHLRRFNNIAIYGVDVWIDGLKAFFTFKFYRYKMIFVSFLLLLAIIRNDFECWVGKRQYYWV